MPDPPLIAVDWGSTNFRATLIVDGAPADRIETADGIRNVTSDASFESILAQRCGAWKAAHPESAIVLSGMIGSREGWVEVPYADTPASPIDLARNMTTLDIESLGRVQIIPGIRHQDEDGTFDVMRGEETQAAGLLANLETDDAVICIPGTHSKWIVCRGSRIESFRTWATGESFQLLSQHSLLAGREASAAIRAESDAFVRGLEHSGRDGGLLHHLFLGRTDMLMSLIAPEDLASLRSGLLVGHEIREARAMASDTVHLIASDVVAPVYEAAFDWFDLPFSRCGADVHSAGIAAIRSAV